MNDMTQHSTQPSTKEIVVEKQDDKAVSDTLGYLALFLIGLAWIGPFIVHMIGYHLYQFITVVLRIPLGSKTSDIVLIGMIVSLAALLLSSVLYWLLKKYGY